MAAIWGIISKSNSNKESTYTELFKKMSDSMSIFPFDRIDTTCSQNVFFACGHQYYTKECEKDISPIHDAENQLVFCSSCFLYNRDNLINTLNDPSLKNAGDSQIAYKAFQQWGFSFVEKLRGDFSFAIYEGKTSILHLFSDHFSKQYIVYSNCPEFTCFSTTYKPVLACIEKNVKINREFIENAYHSPSPMVFYKETITPYENIFQLDCATHVTIDLKTGKETRVQYWNPLKKIQKLKLKNDNEYKIALEIYLSL